MFLKKSILNIEHLLKDSSKEIINDKIKNLNHKQVFQKLSDYLVFMQENKKSPIEIKELWENTNNLIFILLNHSPDLSADVFKLLYKQPPYFIEELSNKIPLHEMLCDHIDEFANLYINNSDIQDKIKFLLNTGHFVDLKKHFPKTHLSYGDEGVVLALTSANMFETRMNFNKEKNQFTINITYNITLSSYTLRELLKRFENCEYTDNEGNWRFDSDKLMELLRNYFKNKNFNFILTNKRYGGNDDRYIFLNTEIPITSYKEVSSRLDLFKSNITDIELDFFP